MAISLQLPRVLPRLRLRRSSASVAVVRDTNRALVDLDLTLPEWETAADLAEDFDDKMEDFLAFEDHDGGSEREWLMG